jgi:hypothetical protein
MRKLLLLLFVGFSAHAFAQHPCVPPAVTISGTAWKCYCVTDTLFVNGPSATTYIWDNGATKTSIITGPICADTTVYVIATNSGCTDTTYYNIVLRIPPSVSLNHLDTVCLGTEICLWPTVSGIGPFTYFWSPGGKTTDSICVSPSVPTIYNVSVSNGCTTTKFDTVFVRTCTGINTITSSTQYNIYPNPSSTSFTLDIQIKALVKVCDITGRVLFSEMEKPGTITFGKELNPGIYFLFINGKPGGKIVKL